MAIPFTGSKMDPAEKAAALAAKLEAKAKKPGEKAAAKLAKAEAKQASKVAKFERKANGLQAKWESNAKLRSLRAEFREKHPEMPTTFLGWCRARLGAVGRGLDSVSPSTFITVADRGVLAALFALYAVCYALDLFFFGTKAPEWYLIPVFIMLGFVLRTTAIAAGVMLESLRGKKEQKGARRTWTLIWLGCVIACIISAVSFFVGGYEKKGAQETAVTTVADAAATNVDTQIAALNAQIDRIRADLAVRIAPLNAEITRLDNDGKRNEELANVQKARRKELEDKADAKIDEIDATKLALLANRGEATQSAATTLAEGAVNQSSTWAVFSWFSGRTGAHERDVVDFGMLFFALLIECMAAFGTSATYALRRWFKGIARRMATEELEEAAQIDLELAEAEKRIAVAKAAAAAARTKELDDDDAVVKQAKDLVEQAKRARAIAEAEAEAARIRAEIEALRNPATSTLTKKQQDAQNAGLASDLANKTRGQVQKIPVGAWSNRADRLQQVA